jgi:hypothetical protein
MSERETAYREFVRREIKGWEGRLNSAFRALAKIQVAIERNWADEGGSTVEELLREFRGGLATPELERYHELLGRERNREAAE